MSDDLPPAGLDRRFYAFCLDRLIAWGLYAVAVVLAIVYLFTRDQVWVGVAVVSGTVALVGLAFVLVLGLTGSSPGMAAAGLRVLDEDGDGTIGLWNALVRTVVLGAAALPTIGLGVAALALNTLRDGTGRRRGWHDRVSHAVVVDTRPPPVVVEEAVEQPRQIVNLTALRLLPAEALPEAALPQRAPAAPPPASPPRSAVPPESPVEPRLQIGTPIRPTAPPTSPPPGPPPTSPPTQLTSALVPSPLDGGSATSRVGPPGAGPSSAPPLGPPPSSRPPVGRPPSGPPPGRPSGPTAGAETGTTWRITFDTGESLVVDGLTLVGRRPHPRTDEHPAHLVALPSADMSLSKTHAQLQVAPDGALVVMDRGSTNGSILVRGGATKELPPGRATTLRDGDRVRLGDRSMSVTQSTP